MLPVIGVPSPLVQSGSLSVAYASYVKDGWAGRDERYKSLPALRRRGVASEMDFVSPERMARSAYWQEWLAPCGLKWFAGVGVMFGGNIWCLSIQRTVEQGPFTPAEMSALAMLSPHLSSAGALAGALGLARIEGALAAYQESRRAVVLLDRAGAVIDLNDAATGLLGDDLQVKDRRIVSSSRAATAHLDRVLGVYVKSTVTIANTSVVVLPRRNGAPLYAHFSRPPLQIGDSLGLCACVITLMDMDQKIAVNEQLLVDLFGLTKAEARLAAYIGAGIALEEASKKLRIFYETARTQLRTLFAKVGTNRQPELTAILATIAERTPGPTAILKDHAAPPVL